MQGTCLVVFLRRGCTWETAWGASRDQGDKVTGMARKSFMSSTLASPMFSFWLSCPYQLLKHWVSNSWLKCLTLSSALKLS